MFNKAILIGRLGRDPSLKTTATGKAVCSFTIATDDFYGGKKQTEWHNIVVWGKQADACDKYLRKGSQVAVDGKIQSRKWETKSGDKRTSVEIVAFNVRFLSSGEAGNSSRSDDDDPPANNGTPKFADEDEEDDTEEAPF